MKVIELGHDHRTLDEVMGLAEEELVVLRKPDGSVFAVSHVDDFDVEVEMLRSNPEFMAFLQEQSRDRGVVSIEDLREELGL